MGPIRSQIAEAIANIRVSLEDPDACEERGLDQYDEDFESEELKDLECPGDVAEKTVFRLSAMPIEEWGSIRVTPKSFFGDLRWDFSMYPLPHPHLGNCLVVRAELLKEKLEHWRAIVASLSFYRIPHFTPFGHIRSYSSMQRAPARITKLVGLFEKHNLYIGDPKANSFRTIDHLSEESVIAYIDSHDSAIVREMIASVLKYWSSLSTQGLLPHLYSCYTRFISEETYTKYATEAYESLQPWEPIELDNYVALVSHCFRLAKDCSADALWLWRTYYPSLVAFDEDKLLWNPTGHSVASQKGVDLFKSYTPFNVGESPWWRLGLKIRLTKISPSHIAATPSLVYADTADGEYLDYRHVLGTIASVMHACIVVIFATTGMRSSEVGGMKSGCVSIDGEGHWLTFTVFKTSASSQGEEKKIPVPEITAQAIEFLEQVCSESRRYGKHDYLLSAIHPSSFGKRMSLTFPRHAVIRMCDAVEIPRAHCHQFRKTLAMYLIYQDPRSVQLIKMLFSHASLKMTMRYIMSLPSIHDEVMRIMIAENTGTLVDIINAAMNEKIGGIAGQRVKESLAGSPSFVAALMDDGKETIEAYVHALLHQGAALLHRTNFAICLRTLNSAERAPCDARSEKVRRTMHPNTSMCEPLNCNHAVFTEENVPSLQNIVIFHQKLATDSFVSSNQAAFSEKQIRLAFTRLTEIDEAQAEAFMERVANG
ncbi:tyrosine-type recombinase/integrase [Noviherbaspirillum pedocola]|uniref:Site-specific integrase n=1 Tax=Noviherbaspirillum pedocola TaxID=2801341 RepID=A0A934SS17_9BURK|nr:site-specific integrase [Noviherbaspirillum pedocola]MBK4735540.1 site-specific integrase [Noviherbaspirillum pedocola]